MTQTPAPPEIPPEALPEITEPPPRQRRVSVAVSWLVIALCVGLMVYRNFTATHATTATGGHEDLAAATEQMEQLIIGRYLVGARVFLETLDPQHAGQHTEHFQTSVDKEIKTPIGRVRAAVIAGELVGGSEAAKRLAAIENNSTLPADVRDAARAFRPIYIESGAASEPDQSRLIKRWGWFGDLALSFGRPDNDPSRVAMSSAALRTFFALLMMLLGFLGLTFVGVVLLIVLLVLVLSSRWRWRFAPAGGVIGAYALEVVAAWFAVFVAVAFAVKYVKLANWGDYHLLAYGVLLAVPFIPLLRGVSWPEWRRALGWHSGSGIFHEMGAGLLGYVAGVPLLAAGAGVTWAINKRTGANPTHPIVFEILDATRGQWWTIIEIFVLAAVWAPLLEETIFRGALYQHLRGWSAAVVAAVISGFIFAVIHPQGFAAIPPLMALAFTFALIREWRGSLIGPMCAHALNNATLVVLLVLLLR